MNFRQRILARIKPFKSAAEVKTKWSRPAKPALFEKAEVALGQPLPEPLREFYACCNGAKIQVERGDHTGELNLVPPCVPSLGVVGGRATIT